MPQIASACGVFSSAVPGGATPVGLIGNFNVALIPAAGGFNGTIVLQKSYADSGGQWVTVSENATGTAASYTGAVALQMIEFEAGVSYRWNCTVYSSGSCYYRISQ